MQGLKMTDGLHSLTVCNYTFVDVTNTYPYRSYELLTVQVRISNACLARQSSAIATALHDAHITNQMQNQVESPKPQEPLLTGCKGAVCSCLRCTV